MLLVLFENKHGLLVLPCRPCTTGARLQVAIAIPSVLHPGLTDPGVEERVTLAEKKPTDRAIERDQLAAQETHQRGGVECTQQSRERSQAVPAAVSLHFFFFPLWIP